MDRVNRPGGPEETPDASHVKNPEVAHEHKDVHIGGILTFGMALLISTALIYLALWGLFKYFSAREIRTQPPPPALVPTVQQRLPPEPRLQGAPGHEVHPLQELRDVRAHEDQMLHGYGWVDRPAGVVRIPVDRAMELLSERGLPSRPPASQVKSPEVPEVSSSGRTLERRER